MDPDLLTADELADRNIVIDPCARCHHLRDSHVYIPRSSTIMQPITACSLCDCPAYLEQVWDYE